MAESDKSGSTRANKSKKLLKQGSGGQLKTKHAGGRPSKYREEYADQARKLCLLGATDADLASFFEVNEDTVNEW